jgi:GABA(A) receptor-associated protein
MDNKFLELRERFPNRVPVLLEALKGCKIECIGMDSKFLAPDDLQVSHFQFIIRKRLRLAPQAETAIFLFLKTAGEQYILPASTATFQELFEEHGQGQGHLQMVFSSENTFG